jgi:membrane protein YqaA with SNARE-associated domain
VDTLALYGALFAWSFLAATLLPIGSELALIGAVRSEGAWFVPVVVATAGNYLGACTTYWIGRRAATALGRDAAAEDSRAARLMRRYGQPSLLLSWVPLVGDALVALAGGVRVPFGSFSVWVVAGKAARYAVVAWVAQAM